MNGQYVPFTISGAIRRGWELFKDNAGFLIGYQIILYILTALLAIFMQRPILELIVWILLIIAKMGFYKSALLISDGIRPGFDQLYVNWRSFLSWVIANILFGVMFAVGLILLIIPGLYVWARYGLFPFFLLDKNLGPISALEQTGVATNGIRWDLFLLFITCVLLNVLGALCFGVGLLVSIPVSLLALASVYQQIKNKQALEQIR